MFALSSNKEKLAILQWWCPSWHVISLLSCAFFGMAYNVVRVQGMQDYVGMPCGRYEHYIEPGWEVTLDQRSREEVDEGNPSDVFPQNSFEAIGVCWNKLSKEIVENSMIQYLSFMLFGVYAGRICILRTFSMPFLHPFRMSRLLEGYFLEW